VFKDSDHDDELTNSLPVEISPKTAPVFDPNSNLIGGKKSRAGRRRRRRNKNKNALKKAQNSVGGEDDTLVAISKIFENPVAEEISSKDNKSVEEQSTTSKDDVEVPLHDKSCAEESGIQEESVNDDFGVDFTADFSCYSELSGLPRIGDILAYKVHTWLCLQLQ